MVEHLKASIQNRFLSGDPAVSVAVVVILLVAVLARFISVTPTKGVPTATETMVSRVLGIVIKGGKGVHYRLLAFPCGQVENESRRRITIFRATYIHTGWSQRKPIYL